MTRSPLISAAENVLRQGLILLQNVDQDSYALKEDGLWGASIGAHYRHVLDHFFCLIEALWNGEVNYDRRVRDPKLETSVEAARIATEELIEAIESMPGDALRQQCTVIYSVGYGGDDAQAVSSVIARELMFCVGHAIHHYAIVKLYCSARSVSLPYEFGIGPSTLKHLATQAAR